MRTDDTPLGPGYGTLTEPVHEAIRLAAEAESLLLDPVYTGRTMAGLIAMARRGELRRGQRVLFVHTGGAPALFAYRRGLARDG